MTRLKTVVHGRNKYRAAAAADPRRVYGGRKYASVLEARYAAHLDLLTRAGEVCSWEAQVSFILEGKTGPLVIGHRRVRHIVDFRVTYADGRVELHETKGFLTPVYKLKMAVFAQCYLAQYPEITYRVITEDDLP